MIGLVPENHLKNSAGCTIVSKNYFGYAKTVAESFLRQNPGHDFHILVVDRATSRERFTCPGAQVVFLEDLGIDGWIGAAFRFDIMELNTNVKPSFLKSLLGLGYPTVYYFDPDIYCFRSVGLLDEALGVEGNILVTPHALSPLPEDGLRPIDRDLLKCGVFNLGFIGVRNREEGLRFLDWWERRCLDQGFNEPALGLFVDQHWIDFAPSYFSGVIILKHPGCNVAYWNIHERSVFEIPGQRYGLRAFDREHELIFFHFSGVDPSNIGRLSKHQSRFALSARPDLEKLFCEYAERLLSNGYLEFKAEPYGFASFEDGSLISSALRRFHGASAVLARDLNPFSAASNTYSFARRNRLFAKSKRNAAGEFNSIVVDELGDPRLAALGGVLRLTLLLIGQSRYELLCKFMRYYGIFNNQFKIVFHKQVSKSFGP